MNYRERSPHLARPHFVRRDEVIVMAAKAKPEWSLSSKAIDLWSLAVCSCLLTLLVHSLHSIPARTTTTATPIPQSSNSSSEPSALFSFKLFTLTSPRPQIKGH